MQLHFWGVRGSIATPRPDNLRHGGNTACLDVRLPTGEILIFDCGTGLRNLGVYLDETHAPEDELRIFFTHFHWDHMQGIPFFLPLYSAEHRVVFTSSLPPEELRQLLEGQMSAPYFPIPFDFMPAQQEFLQIGDQPHRVGDFSVSSFSLHHPQGCSGYRIEANGASIVYASDHEHGDAATDRALRRHAAHADILIYDAQYTPDDYVAHQGWGHSTWLEATRVARDAEVGQLILFHHEPSRTDAQLDAIVESARREFPNTVAAIEGHDFYC
jgi:phosphoribosyl 1,2-cyclic phosphodiesterase